MLIDFYFDPINLTATSNYLAALPDTPYSGQAISLIESQLVHASVKLFELRFQAMPSVTAILVNDGVLHAAVLWKGIGAIFSASYNASGNLMHFPANVNLPISGKYVVCINFWCSLD